MLIHFILKQKLVPFEKSKRVSFASSIVKNMVVFAIESQARFPEKKLIALIMDQRQEIVVYLN